MTRPVWLAAVLILAAPTLAPRQKALEKTIDTLAKDTLSRWDLPGLAVLIVRGDEVVYLKGHGVRERGKADPVTPDTAFALASLTKAFAATALGLLVDDGKADWDDRVSKHLPAFRLADPLADREVRLRDLLCHRTGLARHDLLWHRAPWSLDETVKRLAALPPAHSFRARYEYCNLGYIAAGQAIGNAAGSSWERFTRERLIEPLGMKNAAFTRKAVLALADHAIPHRPIGKARPIEWYPDEAQVRASGSLKASARDLAGWLRLNLNGGSVGGKRIISASSLREIHTPQIVAPVDADLANLSGTTQQSYALGWRCLDYRGSGVLEHGGSADGFRARIALLPRQKAGFVLFTNVEENNALLALGNLLLDELLGVEKKDWHAFYLKQRVKIEEMRALAHKALLDSRRPDTKPSRELAAYAGTYRDAAYGEAVVKATDKGLTLSWSHYAVSPEHFHHDTFLVKGPRRLDDTLARFELSRTGDVTALHWLGRTFTRGK